MGGPIPGSGQDEHRNVRIGFFEVLQKLPDAPIGQRELGQHRVYAARLPRKMARTTSTPAACPTNPPALAQAGYRARHCRKAPCSSIRSTRCTLRGVSSPRGNPCVQVCTQTGTDWRSRRSGAGTMQHRRFPRTPSRNRLETSRWSVESATSVPRSGQSGPFDPSRLPPARQFRGIPIFQTVSPRTSVNRVYRGKAETLDAPDAGRWSSGLWLGRG